MQHQKLSELIFNKKTFLSVGLDTDINKIPSHLKSESNPILQFNKVIIDASAQYCIYNLKWPKF
jgi:orotidine-5'-phosphate decarboxylase